MAGGGKIGERRGGLVVVVGGFRVENIYEKEGRMEQGDLRNKRKNEYTRDRI